MLKAECMMFFTVFKRITICLNIYSMTKIKVICIPIYGIILLIA